VQKIVVIGATGSGKSTFAEQVAARLGLPYIPTDPLFWAENWRRVPLAEVHSRIALITVQPQWVIDGNFDDAREVVWARADTLIWLDYPHRVTWSRLVRRNLGLFLSRTPTWSGNRMTLKMALSGFRHGLRGYRAKRQGYPGALQPYKNARVLRFRRPRDAASWLARL
jgi:adenylate kinase family enzyme